jgi:hypothetical protein
VVGHEKAASKLTIQPVVTNVVCVCFSPAINLLKDKPPGSFVVRNSSTFHGAFGLAVKVAQLPPNVQAKGGELRTGDDDDDTDHVKLACSFDGFERVLLK